ncbi:hypothetical protein TrCOL_g7263 [Triparma columacea]|uniref:Reverse transcriptase domain-containing protein n=1 Tax=Triparma columacea TaxID=722753 RepID=A0A9W7G2V1_9STRA|nr:hypothetical protein TrCOL_g7263 [Triparma columacea]
MRPRKFIGRNKDTGAMELKMAVIEQFGEEVLELGLEGALRKSRVAAYRPGSGFRSREEWEASGFATEARRRFPNFPDLIDQVVGGFKVPWTREPGESMWDLARPSTSRVDGEQKEFLFGEAETEVAGGWSVIVPLNVAKQMKVRLMNYSVLRKVEYGGGFKNRPLRNASAELLWDEQSKSRMSCNDYIDRSILDEIAPVRCAEAAPNLVNACLALGKKHPGRRLGLSKIDMKSCFFQYHIDLKQAHYFGSLLTNKAVLICLRLIQGGVASPAFGPTVTEIVVELFNRMRVEDAPTEEELEMKEWTGIIEDDREQEIFPFDFVPKMAINTHYASGYVDDINMVLLEDLAHETGRAILGCAESAFRPRHKLEDEDHRPAPWSVKKKVDFKARGLHVITGIEVDVRKFTLSITQERADRIREWMGTVFPSREAEVDIDDLLSILGKLQHVSQVRLGGRCEMSCMWKVLTCCPVREVRSIERKGSRRKFVLTLKSEMYAQVQDWLEFLHRPVPMCMSAHPDVAERLRPTIVGCTDASTKGMGGWYKLDGLIFIWQVMFPPEVSRAVSRQKNDGGTLDINLLEHLGIYVQNSLIRDQLKGQGRNMSGVVIMTHCDNQAAVARTNRIQVGSRAGLHLVRTLYKDMDSEGYSARAKYLEGDLNIVADEASRHEWHPESSQEKRLADYVQLLESHNKRSTIIRSEDGGIDPEKVIFRQVSPGIQEAVDEVLAKAMVTERWEKVDKNASKFLLTFRNNKPALVNQMTDKAVWNRSLPVGHDEEEEEGMRE